MRLFSPLPVLTVRPESERLYLYYHYAKKVLDVRHLIHYTIFPPEPNTTRVHREVTLTGAFAVQTAWLKFHLRQTWLVALFRGGRAPGARRCKERRAVECGCTRPQKKAERSRFEQRDPPVSFLGFRSPSPRRSRA